MWSYLCLKSREGSYRPSIVQVFLLYPKRNDSETFKSITAKNFIHSVPVIVSKNVLINCFDKCFLFYVITGRHCFYKSLLIPWGLFNRHVLALLETSNLLSHDKTAILSSMLIPTWKVPKSSFRISYFLNFLYHFYLRCSTFSLQIKCL